MRRDDSVFFFTLVDFMLTALFFGLVLVVVDNARAVGEGRSEREALAAFDAIRKASGISDLTELTDRLTRLGPLSRAEELSRVVTEAGGPAVVREATALINEVGGLDTVAARLARLRSREGAGLPHCIVEDVNGRKMAVTLATLDGTDSTITVIGETPELRDVLKSIGREFSEVRELGLAEFTRTFQRVRQVHANCMYTVVFNEHTRYVEARDAVRGLFYMRIRHEKSWTP